MAYLRSHLTFTRSTVVAGEPVSWESELVPQNLRAVVDYCISRGAYKRFRGVTAGHFAVKIDDTTFLTSRRKTDFNDMKNVGLVKVKTDGPDSVIAYGSKPSVGGQSQRIVFAEHPDTDCIVHFHCPIKSGSEVPTVSQREYECGSHQCGENTSRGLKRFGNLHAVYLKDHGPNIVFSKSVDPQEVIDFIEENFELEAKTGGFTV
jgi:ribulose-5-phosphate 4-epimerase/fuculose-1-phosphate aldolase